MSYPQRFPWTDDSFFLFTAPFLIERNIVVNGVLHIGAHTCEEKKEYNATGIGDERILWIEGNKDLCEQNKKNGIQNIYHALISDTEKDVTFHITNNLASSSLFPLYVHKYFYPHIVESEARQERTMSLPTFFATHSLDPRNYNIWCLDIQGGELDALKGAGDLLDTVDVLFCEINYEKMYEGIPLADSVIQFLNDKGFTATHIKLWQNCWGDALFVKNKYL
jgi:FkbM family methyltransferase